MPSFWNWMEVAGLRQTEQPPTTAESHWPVLMERSAWSRASRLEEQAVSMAKLGPEVESQSLQYTGFPTFEIEEE